MSNWSSSDLRTITSNDIKCPTSNTYDSSYQNKFFYVGNLHLFDKQPVYTILEK